MTLGRRRASAGIQILRQARTRLIGAERGAMPGTRIIIEVPEELDVRQQYEMRTMLSDALHEFATGPRGDAHAYVERCYRNNGKDGEDKVLQVKRRVALAKLLHGPALNFRSEPVRFPMPVYAFYRTCGAHELPAAAALLRLLPASQYGEREGWTVDHDSGFTLHGPNDVRYRWNEHVWERDGALPRVRDAHGAVHWAHLPRGESPAEYGELSTACGVRLADHTDASGSLISCLKCWSSREARE